MPTSLRWDLFCRVVDNHGDAGVCWRVAAELARRGDTVRLWINEARALDGMAPGRQAGVEVLAWEAAQADVLPGDVVVEAFGCDPPEAFVTSMAAAARKRPLAWLNLEYLSAEPYVERCHGLPSPVGAGPGAGLTKHFFYPGFTPATGGLLRERDLAARQSHFDAPGWLRSIGVVAADGPCLSLFCYEPAALPGLLQQLAGDRAPVQLLVTAGRAAAATRDALRQLDAHVPGWNRGLRLHWLPFLTQRDYDHLLWACELNFVRGEDSLVRGLLAGRPAVWHIYPQDDDAHWTKLQAWLDWLDAPASLRSMHRAWNAPDASPPLPPLDIAGWRSTAGLARARIEALPELVTALRRFAQERGRI